MNDTNSDSNRAVEATKTLDTLFFDCVRRLSASVAYREYDRSVREWRSVSWAGLGLEMTRWRGALEREELDTQARVGILLRNCKEWVILEQATMVLDLVTVPLYYNDSLENIEYIIHDAAIKVLVVHELSTYQRLQPIRARLNLQRIILLNVKDDTQEENIREIEDPELEMAKDWLPVEGGPLHERYSDSNTIATIVYTQGTTGRPKGVMLSHLNILTNARSLVNMFAIRPTDIFLSTLSLAHIAERTATYYAAMISGAVVAFGRSPETLTQDLLDVNPSIMVAETHALARINKRIDDELNEHVWMDRFLFKLAVKSGWAHYEVEHKRRSFSLTSMIWPLLKGMAVHAILPKVVGRRLRRIIAIGSPLTPQFSELFLGLGIHVLQGYHLTEASGLVSLNPVMGNDPNSVGFPLQGYKVKIAMNNFLLLDSDNSISPGYMGAASEIDNVKGDWLMTGDMATYENRHLILHGRHSEIIHLAGRKVPINPEAVEMALLADPLFQHAVVFGDGQAFLCAVIALNAERWRQLMGKHNLAGTEIDFSDGSLHSIIAQRLQHQVSKLPGEILLSQFIVAPDAWSVENGMLTPNLKPRRTQIKSVFSKQLELTFNSVIPDGKDDKGKKEKIPTL